jgi:hypothetical protein
MVLWLILGCLLLVVAIAILFYMDGATLGAYSTRLLGIGAVCAGYYGLVHTLRFGQRAAVLRWPYLHYAVPILAGAGALYCLWQVARNWRAEVHGFVKTVLKLVLLLICGALAWLCFTRG